MADVLYETNFRSRVRVYRRVGLAMALCLTVFTGSVVGVVHFALDGVPLAGNAVRVGGRPIATWVGVGLAIAFPLVAIGVARGMTRNGIDQIADDRNVAPGSPTEAERLLDVIGGATFVRYAIAEAAGIVCVLIYHFTADTVLLGLVAALLAFILAGRPTEAGVREWYAAAVDRVADRRQTSAMDLTPFDRRS